MTGEDERAHLHELSAQMPVIAWGLVTAALDKAQDERGFVDAIADLSEDAARLAGGQGGWLILFGRLAEAAAELLTDLADERGEDPRELARARGQQLAERAERWRRNAPGEGQ